LWVFFQGVFSDKKVTITGLNAITAYRFQVFAENGITELAGESDYVDIRVTTEASVPSSVTNVRVTSVKSTEMSLAWAPPHTHDAADAEGDVVEMYEVSVTSIVFVSHNVLSCGFPLHVTC
jgi:ephrin-B